MYDAGNDNTKRGKFVISYFGHIIQMVEHDTFNDSAYHYTKHSGHKGNYFIANTNHGLHLKSKKSFERSRNKKLCKKWGCMI